jgi:hypothetical protein
VTQRSADNLAVMGLPGDFRFRPFTETGEFWNRMVLDSMEATLFHGKPWMDLLEEVFNPRFYVASWETRAGAAACLFARSRNPLFSSLIALPFSDSCAPLGTDLQHRDRLLIEIARDRNFASAYEVRGATAPTPWLTVDCFVNPSIDLDRPVASIDRATSTDFRRQVRRASEAGIAVASDSSLSFMRRFYALQLETRRRHGLPPQPWNFFKAVHGTFAARGMLEISIAHHKRRDLAAIVLLRHRDDVYVKWNARQHPIPSGANHLVFCEVLNRLAGHARRMDLGRTDLRNKGLIRFKHEMGCAPKALPYSFYPVAPPSISVEVLTGYRKTFSSLWRRLPLRVTRLLGAVIYKVL